MKMIIADSDCYAIAQSDFFSANNAGMKYPEFAERFNRLLSQCRDKPKTQKELGAWFGVSQPTVSEWKNGIKLPAMETAMVIAVRLGCCVEYLLTGRGPIKPGMSADQISERQAIVLDAMRIVDAATAGRLNLLTEADVRSLYAMAIGMALDGAASRELIEAYLNKLRER